MRLAAPVLVGAHAGGDVVEDCGPDHRLGVRAPRSARGAGTADVEERDRVGDEERQQCDGEQAPCICADVIELEICSHYDQQQDDGGATKPRVGCERGPTVWGGGLCRRPEPVAHANLWLLSADVHSKQDWKERPITGSTRRALARRKYQKLVPVNWGYCSVVR